ncbi:hypothetical protein HBDW_11290 [Herbaspirillum sp. DW155]|uniref:hypothetical protein n=1 Tax=Herbaspirillum sp. DW155 TaxID=3095609 RepID=UPI00308D48BC|nr:hypothetical protein HBDW_11290 [Herbaspirillum sp. DW155]
MKSEGYPGYEEFPQIPDISSKNPKYKAKFDISFDCINGEYYCNQGQQRSIIARYAIYQRFGICSCPRNSGHSDIVKLLMLQPV